MSFVCQLKMFWLVFILLIGDALFLNFQNFMNQICGCF